MHCIQKTACASAHHDKCRENRSQAITKIALLILAATGLIVGSMGLAGHPIGQALRHTGSISLVAVSSLIVLISIALLACQRSRSTLREGEVLTVKSEPPSPSPTQSENGPDRHGHFGDTDPTPPPSPTQSGSAPDTHGDLGDTNPTPPPSPTQSGNAPDTHGDLGDTNLPPPPSNPQSENGPDRHGDLQDTNRTPPPSPTESGSTPHTHTNARNQHSDYPQLARDLTTALITGAFGGIGAAFWG